MPSIIHFEIHAGDVERAIRFYTTTFGWNIEKWKGPEDSPDYYIVMTKEENEPGINGGLMPRDGFAPSGDEPIRAFVCTIGVDSIDDQMKRIEANGGKLISPKMAVMSTGWLCYAEDTEGNLFGIMQRDETAE